MWISKKINAHLFKLDNYHLSKSLLVSDWKILLLVVSMLKIH